MSAIECSETAGNYQKMSKDASEADSDLDEGFPKGNQIEADFKSGTIILTVATYIAHFLSSGVSYSIGMYLVTFLEVFEESYAVTSWIGSLNTGTLCATGMYTMCS